MAGNTWEWCLEEDGSKRLVHGGAFISPHQRAEIEFRYYLAASNYHSTIGFRVVMLA
jgi:formylglycine-generating enzyme required for sulfatase activity